MTEHHASKWKGLAWVMVACAAGVCVAFGLAPMARAVPWSWEKKLGDALNNDSVKTCRFDPSAQALLERIVTRLYPIEPGDKDFSIHVRIVDDPTVNAFAGLGGHITIDSGLLKQAESPDEIAGVLAHEIGHVQHRHIMEGALAHLLSAEGISIIFGSQSSEANWASYFLNMSFSRSQEAQADEAGLARLQIAHVDNSGFRDFFQRMEKSGAAPAFLSDHPSNWSRIEMAEKFPNNDVTPIMTPAEWQMLKNYCGK